jgi:hypothetical protein
LGQNVFRHGGGFFRSLSPDVFAGEIEYGFERFRGLHENASCPQLLATSPKPAEEPAIEIFCRDPFFFVRRTPLFYTPEVFAGEAGDRACADCLRGPHVIRAKP